MLPVQEVASGKGLGISVDRAILIYLGTASGLL